MEEAHLEEEKEKEGDAEDVAGAGGRNSKRIRRRS